MKFATNQDQLNELFDADPRNDSAIAADLGVSKQTISAWRKGIRSPKKKMLMKIASAYHVDLEWLMGYEEEGDIEPGKFLKNELENYVPTTREGKIIARGIDGLDDPERQRVLNVLRLMLEPTYGSIFNDDIEDYYRGFPEERPHEQ